MRDTGRIVIRGFAACALICFATSFAQAGTILKLNLGNVGPDVGMNTGGLLSTVDDGVAATTGDQNTAVEFTDFLDPIPDISTSMASFTLSNLVETPAAFVVGGALVTQAFSGGQFSLYDPSNTLLLQGALSQSVLTGNLGPVTGTGALFTIDFADVTGGTLAPLIVPHGSLSLSINMTNVNGGAGFNLAGPVLAPFFADASVNIAANPTVPEPASLTLVVIGSGAALAFGRRRRR
jgi:PEP-CTERM motif